MPRKSYSRSRSKSFERRPRKVDDRGYRGGGGGRSRSRSRSPPASRGYRGGGGGGPPMLSSENQVYVARFGRRTTEYDLKKAFEVYGFIEKIDLKEGRGFGFIYFENRRDAEDAIEDMNGRSLPHEDERLVVEKAQGGRRRGGGGGGYRGRSRSGDRGGERGERGPRSDMCYNCNKDGHHAKDCPESPKKREPRLQDGRCFICDEKGHKKIDCPTRRGGGGGREYRRSRSPPQRRGRSPRSRSRSHSDSRRNRSRRQFRERNEDGGVQRSREKPVGRPGGRRYPKHESKSRSLSPRDRKFKSKGRSYDKSQSQKQQSQKRSPSRSLSGERKKSRSRSQPRRQFSKSATPRSHSKQSNRSKSCQNSKSAGDAETDATAVTQLQGNKIEKGSSQQNIELESKPVRDAIQ